MAQLGYFQDRHHEFTLTASAKPPLLPLPSARAGKRTNGFQGANGNATNANGTKLNDDDSAYQRYTTAASPREVIPWHHRNRSDLLHQSVLKSWQAAEPSSARKQEIAQLLDTLTHTINFSTPTHENPTRDRYKVDAFGSMAWGGDTGRSGDLDLIVIDTHLPRGYAPSLWRSPPGTRSAFDRSMVQNACNPRVPQIYDVDWLAGFLYHSAGMIRTQAIAATTPIVKFNPRNSDLKCDINVNDMGGWYNSRLILAYCEISPHVLRPLVHALKKWLAQYNLNDSSGQNGQRSMSSYCLTLMAIAYLQSIGALPNLQASARDLSAKPHDPNQKDVIWVSWGREQGQVAHIAFERVPPAGWFSTVPHLTVDEALRGFFQYFAVDGAAPRFQYASQFISIVNGGIVERRRRMGVETRLKQEYRRRLGYLSKDALRTRMREYEEQMDARHVVGKCDRFQPRRWGDCKLVVQDPFLWEKNCAGTMERSAVDRFILAVRMTNAYLEGNDGATLAGMLNLDIEE